MTGLSSPARGRVEEPPAERPDLRLVPAALLSWLVAILGLAGGWLAAAVCTAAAAVLAAFAASAVGWPGSAPRRLRLGLPGRYAAGALASAGCVAAVGLVVTLHAVSLAGHPLRLAAGQGSAATVRVAVSGDPAPVLSAPGYGGLAQAAGQVSIRADLLTASSGGQTWAGGGRVLLLAPREGWEQVLPGMEITASGLLAPATRPDLTVAVLRVRGPPTGVTAAPWWQRAADVPRDGLRRAATEVLPEDSAALLPALAIGDTSLMSATLRDEFRAAGLTHLSAVSGANVVILVGAVFGLLTLLRAGPRTRVAVALIALVGFVILARPSPSVLRAAVMGGVGLFAVLAGRRRPVVPALAASAIVLLLVDPALGTDPGFALSVMATGALALVAPPWAAWLRARGVPPGVAEALAVPAAAHLVTAPLVAGISGQVSLVAVAANLLAAPAVAPITVLGALAAVVSPMSDGVAEACAWLAGPAVAWLVEVAHLAAGTPGAAVAWPRGVGGALLLGAVLLLGVVLVRRRRVRAVLVAACLGALLVLVPSRFVTPGWPVAGWAMVACDVGQGDALVLATGLPGRAVLVDAGTETAAVDSCLSRLGVHALSLVVISHLHADHMGGLAAALRGRAVGAVALGPARRPAWAFDRVLRVAGEQHVPVLELRAGQRLRWPGLLLEVLAPSGTAQPIDPEDGTDVNNTSVVIRAHTPGGRVMLTGDIELLAQANLISSGADLRAEVLKVPHHGSRYTSTAFLAAVRPRLALVSVGAGNRYGHPNATLLASLRAGGALVRRTDESGDVAVVAARDGPVAVSRGHPRPPGRRG